MLDHLNLDTLARVVAFFSIMVLMMAWEVFRPKRQYANRTLRWPGNLGIFLINVIVLSILPITAVAAALVSIEYKFGLFFLVEIDFWPKFILSVILLDLVIYWQHRIFHQIPWFWRIHRMHHTDTMFDVTTALRFHPIEIALSMLIKAVAIVLLGAPVFAVILFEVILNGCAMFNHSNIRLPVWVDKIIRWFIVTPDMHRVHHSIHPEEHNRNYGFSLSVWDRVFSSYQAQPAVAHDKMAIGLTIFDAKADARLDKLLVQPFLKPKN